jgi:acyl-CoA reductase-like NAD-dependent aldehyde dehydrogenase
VTRELQFIGGAERPAVGGRWWTVVDPATGAAVGEVPWGDGDDARAAIDAAAEAFPAWSRRTAYERGAILERAAELIRERVDAYARRTSEESGKPLAQSRGEWAGAPNYLRTAAEEARALGGRWIPARMPGRRIDVTYAPLGVVGVITAWNFPIYNVNRAVASALAAGCCAVVRPSEFTPRTALDYARALHEAGLPPGVLQRDHGRAARDRAGDAGRPALPQDRVHGVDAGREIVDGGGGAHGDAAGARARGERAGDRVSGRRRGGGGAGRGDGAAP